MSVRSWLLWSLMVPLAASSTLAGEKLDVFVSIAPQAYLVERIGGEHVRVEVLVREGQSPHTYQATPRQMVRLGEADLYFSIGVDFERALLPRVTRTFPDLRVIDSRAGIPLRRLEVNHVCTHEDGHHHHEHAAGGEDPHVWMSPRLAKTIAKNISTALEAADPEHADAYRAGLAALHADLDRTRREIAEVLAPVKGERVYVFHPAFGYFLDEFGLRQVAVEIEGKQPSARQLVRLIEQARQDKVHVIFVQPQFSPKSAEAIAEAIGGAVVPIDPLARAYLKNIQETAVKLKSGLTK
jgi:zinc transport system substrate-binding protein